MKTVFLILIFGGLVTMFTLKANQRTPKSTVPYREDSIDFRTTIQPILVKNCSPCHFAGGKMYDRMPFDKGETIIKHQTGILRRIKKAEENELLKQFISQRNSAN
ncbi:MAG: hypothetical protein ACJ749_09845 [Flavisolibacter sp.]